MTARDLILGVLSVASWLSVRGVLSGTHRLAWLTCGILVAASAAVLALRERPTPRRAEIRVRHDDLRRGDDFRRREDVRR